MIVVTTVGGVWDSESLGVFVDEFVSEFDGLFLLVDFVNLFFFFLEVSFGLKSGGIRIAFTRREHERFQWSLHMKFNSKLLKT